MEFNSCDDVLFSHLKDEELIDRIRSGSEKSFDALIKRYAKTVMLMSGSYYSESLTKDDWFQEGMLGLLFAVHSYSRERGVSFGSYASVCIKNHLNSSWKKANNSKNAPLNGYISYDDTVIPSVNSPEDDYIQNERYRSFTENYTDNLSGTEQKVFGCYLSGFSYEEIAKKLGMTEKSVDNALCRAKSKLKKAFNI